MHRSIILVLAMATLTACGTDTNLASGATATSPEETLRLQLETAQSGDVIEVVEGVYRFDRGLILNTDGVTIRGVGMGKSILSFAGQLAGAEGLLVNANDFTIEDLAIEDAKGDALKINEGKNIVVRRVRTEWTNGPKTENGAYGIYPVQTENTLIEGSVAIGASDAGIYVGQSRNVVVSGNRAEFNVAGIEIENTVGADVYDNVATNNTGGILVFNMPDLPIAGHSTRVFDNTITANNTPNFGIPGTAVAGVPAGSGIVINANDKVEIFNNHIVENQTANILISSYFSAGYEGKYKTDESFDPYPESIFIYNNTFSGGGNQPDRAELANLLKGPLSELGRLPDIVWDGYVNADKNGDNPAICVSNGSAIVLNVDAGNDYQNATMAMDAYQCEHPKLDEITLASSG